MMELLRVKSSTKDIRTRFKLHQLLDRQRTEIATRRRSSGISNAFAVSQPTRLKRMATQGTFDLPNNMITRREARDDSTVSRESVALLAWGSAVARTRVSRHSILKSSIGSQSRRVSDGLRRRLRTITGESDGGEDSMTNVSDEDHVNINIRAGFQVDELLFQ